MASTALNEEIDYIIGSGAHVGEWLRNYELHTGAMTPEAWRIEFNRFKQALREYWKSQGIEVGW